MALTMDCLVNIANNLNGSWFPLGVEPNQGWRVDAATLALLVIIGDATWVRGSGALQFINDALRKYST